MKLRTKVKRLKEENERLKNSTMTLRSYDQLDTSVCSDDWIKISKKCLEDNLFQRVKHYIKHDEHRFTHNPRMTELSAELTIVIPEGKR